MEEENQFRLEVREFLEAELTPEILEAGRKATSIFAPFDAVMKWQRILYEKGWVAPAWPEEHGGPGWSEDQQAVFHEECVAAGAPRMLPHGLAMLGPLIFNKGTAEQKQKYLPGILSGDDFWAQGYSEPGAGSDLASLKCRAISDGSDYLVSGSKIWTTYAHYANKMFMLVRTSTDGKPQAGITFLLLDDIHAEGITVRPIIGLDGLAEQCEVFFDCVRIPKSNTIGAENDGWAMAKFLLLFERGGMLYGPTLLKEVEFLKSLVEQRYRQKSNLRDPREKYGARIGRLAARARAISYTERRLRQQAFDARELERMAPMMKVQSSELTQEIAELRVEIVGLDSLAAQVDALQVGRGAAEIGPDYALTPMAAYLNSRACTIYAGSNEIQRDLIARAVLDQ